MSICLSVCLYLSVCVLNTMSVTGRNQRWSLKLFMLMRTLERQILSNASVREEVTVVGDWVSCTGGVVGESKKGRCVCL